MEDIPKPDQKEILLSKLEDYFLLTQSDKVNLLFVLEGLKHVCSIELNNPDKNEYIKNQDENYRKNTEVFENEIRSIQELLPKLGLYYSLSREHVDRESDSPGYEIAFFHVGQSQVVLDELEEIYKEKDANNMERRLGTLYGFPETAVDGWCDGKIKDINTLPEEVRGSAYINFLDFVLSSDHWKEELEPVKEKAENVHNIAPNLYAEIVAEESD